MSELSLDPRRLAAAPRAVLAARRDARASSRACAPAGAGRCAATSGSSRATSRVDPTTPGVLLLESIAQCGGGGGAGRSERYAGRLPLFGGVEHARFRRQVVPGDVVDARVRDDAAVGARGQGARRATRRRPGRGGGRPALRPRRRDVRVATWNVNSLTARWPRGSRRGSSSTQPDVVLIQETKQTDAKFPFDELAALGYDARPLRPGSVERRRGPLARRDRRTSSAASATTTPRRASSVRRAAGVRVYSCYVPNGRALDDPHYAYKLRVARPTGRPRRGPRPRRAAGRRRRLQRRAERPGLLRPRARSSARRT